MSSVLAAVTVHSTWPSSVLPSRKVARRRHPVERLVGPAVGVHEHRPVGLDHQHPGGHRQVGGQPPGVVDLAARNDDPHGDGIYPCPGPLRLSGRRASMRGVTATDTGTSYDVHELRRAFPGAGPGPGPLRRTRRVARPGGGRRRGGRHAARRRVPAGRTHAPSAGWPTTPSSPRGRHRPPRRPVRPARHRVRAVDDGADLRHGPHPVARAGGPATRSSCRASTTTPTSGPGSIAAERAGATVRWLGFDPVTAELDDVRPLLTDRTRLVAVTAASNLFGTRPDVAGGRAGGPRGRRAGVRRRGPPRRARAGRPGRPRGGPAGLLAVQVLRAAPGVARGDPALLERAATRQAAALERRGAGALRAGDAALRAAGRRDGGRGVRRDVAGMAAVERHEAALLDRLLDGLGRIGRVTVHGRPARRTPTVLVDRRRAWSPAR